MKRNVAYILGITLILLSVYVSQGTGVSSFVPSPLEAEADVINLKDYAWSDGAGWISFEHGSDRVTITTNPNGDPMPLNGYAWSDAIGWIRFGGMSGCPAGTCNARIEGIKLLGWARACSVFASGCSGTLKSDTLRGGWDGWISLHADNTGATGYGVSVGLNRLSGYAWGSEVVGWINMEGVSFDAPCESSVGQTCSADKLSYNTTDQWCQVISTPCPTGTLCSATNSNVSCVIAVPSGTFEAAPARVRKGNEVTLTWNVSNVGACRLSATPTLPDGQTFDSIAVDINTATANGSQIVSIENETTFRLQCDSTDGTNQNTLIGTPLVVPIIPSIEYI